VTDARNRRRSGPWRRALPWLVAAGLLAAFGVPTAAAVGALPVAPVIGDAHPESGNVSAVVNLTDTPRFVPNSLAANASATLSVELVNQGSFNHTFTMSKVPGIVLNTSWTPTELDAFFATNGTLANVSVAPGTTAWANVTFNSSVGGDTFEFASIVPYQFQAGMWGFVNVSATGPGLQLSDNTTNNLQFVPNVLVASSTHFPLILDVLVTNTGSLGHTFTVSPLDNYSLSVANYTQTLATNPPLVSASVPSGAGGTVWANFTVRGPGFYQYICTVTGHFANGMYGFLYVDVAPPPVQPPPSTALVETWVLLGSGALLGAGILIAVVASFSGRFPRRGSPHDRRH
jgi:uncharacterized cupredoxin-like copper-binding protein